MIDSFTNNKSRRAFLKTAGAWSVATLGFLGFPGYAQGSPAARRRPTAVPIPADGIARGVVFLDANQSGNPSGQRGLPGILICNGKDIVRTDAEGRYEIPVADHTIVYVIKPRGYMTALDELNLPRFYYIHKPNGSPDRDFIYKGVAPTGPLPDAIDFPLYEANEPDEFEVLFTADPQPYNLQHLHWYGQETSREFSDLDVAFGIALGDIVGDHLDLLEPYNKINALTGFPWYNVVGNHDLNFMAREDRFSDETFKRIYGPTTYAFQRGPVHFIILNNVFWEGFTRMRADGWPRRGQYRGHLRPWQLEFVRNYLKHVPTDERIVVCTHIPLFNHSDESAAHATPEVRQLLEILSTHPNTMSFSGHTHINMNFLAGPEAGYRAPGGARHHHFNLTATCGSWYRGPLDHAGLPYSMSRDGTPKGYAVVRFEGGENYHIRFKALGLSEDHQMSVSLPHLIERHDLSDTNVHVNVFNATEKTTVKMRLDGGAWISLTQQMAEDPAFIALRERAAAHPEAGAGELPAPLPTSHHWSAPLPASLATGWHQVEIESTNLFGERWRAHRTFTVAENQGDLEHLNMGTRTVRARG